MDTPRSSYPTFSWTERRRLLRALAQAHDARLYRRLRAVAEIAEGESVAVVAKRARVERSTVYRWIERYLAERAPSALADGKRSGRPRLTPALTDAKLRQLLSSEPCQFGYDANTWTVPLLAKHLHTQGIMISDRTLRRGSTRSASDGSVRAMSTANGRRMSAPKRGHCPTAETPVPGGRRAVVHRLDAAAPVSPAEGDVGGDRHAGHGVHHWAKRQTRPVWHDQCANRTPDGHHRPRRRDA